jgi:hypothetical protein
VVVENRILVVLVLCGGGSVVVKLSSTVNYKLLVRKRSKERKRALPSLCYIDVRRRLMV